MAYALIADVTKTTGSHPRPSSRSLWLLVLRKEKVAMEEEERMIMTKQDTNNTFLDPLRRMMLDDMDENS